MTNNTNKTARALGRRRLLKQTAGTAALFAAIRSAFPSGAFGLRLRRACHLVRSRTTRSGLAVLLLGHRRHL